MRLSAERIPEEEHAADHPGGAHRRDLRVTALRTAEKCRHRQPDLGLDQLGGVSGGHEVEGGARGTV